MSNSEVYRHPRYYAIGYQWNTEAECDFIEACLRAYGPVPPLPRRQTDHGETPPHGPREPARLLDIGCGAGRHLTLMAQRGYRLTGLDASSEMIAYVSEAVASAGLEATAQVDDLLHLTVGGTYEAAYCFMDTFRFLLTNEEIIAHLRAVAERLAPGGLYLVDFWIPRQWDQAGHEIFQWERTEDHTTVRVFYLQHPDSVDPVAQTFDDELIFEVQEDGSTRQIRGGPTRTRLILPQEFRALVDDSGAFSLLGTFGDFEMSRPLTREHLSWRMISALKKR
jgi:SAM-dependent methyltransferase